MITAETRTVVLADAELDLAGPGNRVRFSVPDSVAGDLVLHLRRLSGWAAQAVELRAVLPGGVEVDLSGPVSVAAPTSPVEAARAVVPNTAFTSGDELALGVETAEAGRVLVRVTIVVTGRCACSH